MRSRPRSNLSILRWVAQALIFAALLLTVIELVRYSRMRFNFPTGMEIAGVQVGGLSHQQAAERLVQAYGVPVELHYRNAIIQIKPALVGFELDLETMFAAADLQRITQSFWAAFWDFLWNRLPVPSGVPLVAKVSEARLRSYLRDEIASRYDEPPTAAMPVPGTTDFNTGNPGSQLNIDGAVNLIESALKSPNGRIVNLTISKIRSVRPSFQNLQIMLQQVIDVSGFDGLTDIYLLDLQTGQELSLAYERGKSIDPNISFTAASTMKIPIMISAFRRLNEPTPPAYVEMIKLMIERSENDPADRLMENLMDKNLGPLQVTTDIETLGFQNTFMAGYFHAGAPLLKRFVTPANSRQDVVFYRDPYNQTTPAEIGQVLEDIYYCAEHGNGALMAVFPGEISQSECRQMIDYLSANRIGIMIQGGLPEGTKIANKHAWAPEPDGLLHTMADVGIVYSPGGNFIISIFLTDPVQLIFDPVNVMIGDLSRSVYNYFNLLPQ